MSAGARTDSESSVVLATLEAMEMLLKALRGRSLALESRVVESLVVTVQDIMANKVCYSK